ncbi:unnamed protein product [Gadus morhua 'NCC']
MTNRERLAEINQSQREVRQNPGPLRSDSTGACNQSRVPEQVSGPALSPSSDELCWGPTAAPTANQEHFHLSV